MLLELQQDLEFFTISYSKVAMTIMIVRGKEVSLENMYRAVWVHLKDAQLSSVSKVCLTSGALILARRRSTSTRTITCTQRMK